MYVYLLIAVSFFFPFCESIKPFIGTLGMQTKPEYLSKCEWWLSVTSLGELSICWQLKDSSNRFLIFFSFVFYTD